MVATVLMLATTAAYLTSFSGVFLLDDFGAIAANPTLRKLWPLSVPLSPPPAATVSGRPLANLTFALNYAVHGLDPWGYHAVNLAIHLAAGLALFGLVRRTLRQPCFTPARSTTTRAAELGEHATPAAFCVALVWLLHPLQTESVTYVVQRVESLMGCFFLLTFYAYARAAAEPNRKRWIALAIGACWLGAASKEVIAAAPVLALLYDRTFVTGSWRESWRQRRGLLLGLASCWMPLAVLVISNGGNRSGSMGLGAGLSFVDYWLTQPGALATYLKLAVWPSPLVFEYGMEWVTDLGSVAPAALLILALAALTVVAVVRWPAVGFLGAWFFAILAPTSLLPGSQLVVEHRMYLPLAALIAGGVGAGFSFVGRRSMLGWLAIALAFGALTARRNLDYRDAAGMWRDVLEKKPLNALAHENLALTLEAAGQLEAGLAHRAAAVELAPNNAALRYNYGGALLEARRHAEAARELARAVELEPGSAVAHNNLALSLAHLGRREEALRHHALAAQAAPEHPAFRYNYGLALLRAQRPAEAAEQLRAAVARDPAAVPARIDLGNALLALGQTDGALAEFQAAARLEPGSGLARRNLGAVLGMLGRLPEAEAEFRAALAAEPDSIAARFSLGDILLDLGRAAEAAIQYQGVLQTAPNHAGAHEHLGLALARLARWADAIPHHREAVRLRPREPGPRLNLAEALGRAGRWADAAAEYETCVQLWPAIADAHANLGVAYEHLGLRARAAAAYEAALAIDPAHAAARENLARVRP